MPRFVALSFLLLAWAFYELSGGSDFVPRGMRPPQPEPHAETGATPREAVTQLASVTLKPKPVIAPRQTGAAAEPTMTAQAHQAARLEQLRAGLGQSLSFAAGDGSAAGLGAGLELASLAQGAAGLHQAAAQMPEDEPAPVTKPAAEPFAEPARDIREVSGLRVNMRDGPGTIYPVIARLQIGDKVEVLSESGTGWLRLRTANGQQIGWVAASLIGKRAD
ncbi:MAG: SH3 domain-containing protein [Pseudodonghicola sp.]